MRFVALQILIFSYLVPSAYAEVTAVDSEPIEVLDQVEAPDKQNKTLEEARVERSQERVILASGMSRHQVVKRFGDPDKEETPKDSPLTLWRYGKSVIIFQNRRVSVWIDNGELGVRELVPKRSKREVSGDEVFRRSGWKNVYRRGEKKLPQSKDVLDELLDD